MQRKAPEPGSICSEKDVFLSFVIGDSSAESTQTDGTEQTTTFLQKKKKSLAPSLETRLVALRRSRSLDFGILGFAFSRSMRNTRIAEE